MLRFGSFPACILMFGLTTACTNSPAPDTREADVRAVRDVEAAWVKDIGTKDVEKFVAYYADDATVLMPNKPKSVTTDKGKYLTVFRKQPDNSWKAVADMINSDQAIAQPAKTTPKRSRSRR